MADHTVLQWATDGCAAIGLVKLDLLSLGMLPAPRYTIESIRDYHGVNIALDRIRRAKRARRIFAGLADDKVEEVRKVAGAQLPPDHRSTRRTPTRSAPRRPDTAATRHTGGRPELADHSPVQPWVLLCRITASSAPKLTNLPRTELSRSPAGVNSS